MLIQTKQYCVLLFWRVTIDLNEYLTPKLHYEVTKAKQGKDFKHIQKKTSNGIWELCLSKLKRRL